MIFISFCTKEVVTETGTRAAAKAEEDKIQIVIVTDAIRIYYVISNQGFFFFFRVWGELCTVHMCFEFYHNFARNGCQQNYDYLVIRNSFALCNVNAYRFECRLFLI